MQFINAEIRIILYSKFLGGNKNPRTGPGVLPKQKPLWGAAHKPPLIFHEVKISIALVLRGWLLIAALPPGDAGD
jgi:hypothetical protein